MSEHDFIKHYKVESSAIMQGVNPCPHIRLRKVISMSKDTKTTTKDEKDLLPFNPLMDAPLVSVDEETETRVQMIEEVESLAEINKQQLAAKRQQAELIVDNKKLDTALKTIDTVDKIIESVANEEVLARVAGNIETPQDMKYMTEAADRLTSTLKNLMNPNVADEFGNRKHHKINIMFKGQGAVSVDVPRE